MNLITQGFVKTSISHITNTDRRTAYLTYSFTLTECG